MKSTKKPKKKRATLAKEDSDDDDSDSEEPSPVKRSERVARAEVVLPKKTLAERINEMNPEQKEDFKKEMKTAFIAKAARGGVNSHLPCRAYTRLNGGRSAGTDGVFDSGCTAPITTKAVIDDMKMLNQHKKDKSH